MWSEGTLVQLDSGAWAELRRIPVRGPTGPTVLVAVELDADAQRKLATRPRPASHALDGWSGDALDLATAH
jgi:hypothetical protein